MMSRVELERFVADVKADPRLQARLGRRDRPVVRL
jgi:hypothetical protein